MSSRNLAIVLGRLGRDPETRRLPDDRAVTSITMATSENWTNKDGEKREATEWHRVSFFGKLADIASKYLHKGDLAYVEGKLHTRMWEKDGHKNYSTEIRAERLQLLGSKGTKEEGESSPGRGPQASAPVGGQQPQREWVDDDIPF